MYVRGNDKRLKVEYDTLQKVKNNLLEGKHVRFLEWDEKEMGLESFVSSKFINFFQKNPLTLGLIIGHVFMKAKFVGPAPSLGGVQILIPNEGNGRFEQTFVLDC